MMVAKKTGLWRFTGPLRIMVSITAAIYALYYMLTWLLAWFGETELAFDFVGIVSEAPLTPLQIIGGMICAGMDLSAMIIIAITANKFLKTAYRDGFFEAGIARTLKQLGFGLILFYVGLMLSENLMPWILTRNLAPELQEDIGWFFLDPTLVALLVGFVLLLLAGAMDEAREIDTDNKQFI